MQGLVGGAECGPINPLAQMLKHTEGDRSIQLVCPPGAVFSYFVSLTTDRTGQWARPPVEYDQFILLLMHLLLIIYILASLFAWYISWPCQ